MGSKGLTPFEIWGQWAPLNGGQFSKSFFLLENILNDRSRAKTQ